MSQLQRLDIVGDDGQTIEIFVEEKDAPVLATSPNRDGRPSMGAGSPSVKMQQMQQVIRGYATYALNAFKDFSAAEVEEITLKFGVKLSASAGIPYIANGTTDSNLEVQVKCRFPTKEG